MIFLPSVIPVDLFLDTQIHAIWADVVSFDAVRIVHKIVVFGKNLGRVVGVLTIISLLVLKGHAGLTIAAQAELQASRICAKASVLQGALKAAGVFGQHFKRCRIIDNHFAGYAFVVGKIKFDVDAAKLFGAKLQGHLIVAGFDLFVQMDGNLFDDVQLAAWSAFGQVGCVGAVCFVKAGHFETSRARCGGRR